MAGQLLEYLRYRATGRGTTRVFVADYPRDVLEAACRALVERGTPTDRSELDFGDSLAAAIALIQTPDDVATAPGVEGDYQFGVSPDFPVALRNRRGNVVVACPPELIDLCHESIKTNSFQRFSENRRFGSEIRLFEGIAAAITDRDDERRAVAEAVREVYRRERARRGAEGERSVFERIERWSEAGRPPDWRLLGLLPHARLDEALRSSGSEGRRRIREAVRRNFEFQADLVEGLAREQNRYLQRRFSAADGFAELREFVGRRALRLNLDDLTWRTEWPSDLTLERLATGRPSGRATRVSGLSLRGDSEALGVTVASERIEASWRLPRSVDALPGSVPIDGDPVVEVDLAGRSAVVEPLDLAPGFHDLGLEADDVELEGLTRARFFVVGEEPYLLATVGTAPTGAGSYSVAEGESFRLSWTVLPPTQPAGYVVRLLAGVEEDTIDERVPPDRNFFDFVGGIDHPVDVRIEARSDSDELLFATEIGIALRGDERVPPAASVGQALLRVGAELAPDVERPRGRVYVEPTAEAYEVRIETDDEFEARQFRPRHSPLLDSFERTLLDQPARPYPMVASRVRRGRTHVWELAGIDAAEGLAASLPSPQWSIFTTARSEVLERLGAAGGSAGARLADLEEEIERYASAYRELLAALFAGEEAIDRPRVLACLLDCVLVPRDPPTFQEETEAVLEDTPGDLAAVLVSPTHPLRVAWLLRFERFVERAFREDMPWSHEAVQTLSSRAFPACLIDWEVEHFHAATTAGGGRWSLLLREGENEIDRVLPVTLSRQLDVDSPLEASSTTGQQLAAAVLQFHELHPQRDALRLGYVNPGTAEKLLESLEQLVAGSGKPRGQLARATAARCGYELNLFDVHAGAPDRRTGAAFGQYAAADEPDQRVLDRVAFGVDHVPAASFTADDNLPTSHILFGSNVFSLRGESIPIAHRALSPALSGLILHPRRALEPTDPPRVVSCSFVSRPGDWGRPAEDTSVAGSLHGIAFGLQAAAAASPDRRTASQTQGRATLVEIDPAMARAIDAMHDLSDWVYLMDTLVDVEYFDRPALEERYVIDYVPRILGGDALARRHNYVVSTKNDAVLQAAINRFLYGAYDEHDIPEGAAARLSRALNRVSGRLLLRLIGDPAWAKGAVGMGLTQLLLGGLGALRPAPPQRMSALVPIDDYATDWNRELGSLQASPSRDRADLLHVAADIGDDGRARLTFQVIEIKNVRRSYSAADLAEGPFRQVAHTARMLETLHGFGSAWTRSDAAIKDHQLAQLLDFHLRRTAMQEVGDDSGTLAAAADFRSRLFAAIAEGAYDIGWRSGGADRPLLGFVAHFNAQQEYASGGSAPEPLEAEEGLGFYLGFGKPDIASLLAGRVPEALEEREDWFSPTAPAPAPPAPSERAEPTTETAAPPGAREAPAEVTRAQEAFEGFVGNEPAVRRLLPWLAVAARESPPRLPENIAFTGPASTGKTELARRVARALGLPFLAASGSALRSLDDLLEKMERSVVEAGDRVAEVAREGGQPARRFPPLVVFVDEAHELRRAVQEQLLTLLEPRDRRARGSHFVADARDVTFVFATTDWGDLIPTIQSRMQRVPLEPYSLDEVTEMVLNLHQDWPREVCQRLAVAGRQMPRVALQKAQEFANALEAFPDKDPDVLLDEYFELWRLDERGIDDDDRRYMRILDESRGPMGLDRIANRMRMGEREIARGIEPYLETLRLVEVGTRGRDLAEAGKAYLRSLRRREDA